MLAKLNIVVVPTSCAVFDFSRWDYCKLGEGKYYKLLLTPQQTNIPDAIIGDTSICEEAVLVTDDQRLKNKMNRIKESSCIGYT